jgi:hypothetical protein
MGNNNDKKRGWKSQISNPVLVQITIYNYFVAPIRNILVLHIGHTPWVAGLPFFIVTALALFISFLVLHFTQYASITLPPVLNITIRLLREPVNPFLGRCFSRLSQSDGLLPY